MARQPLWALEAPGLLRGEEGSNSGLDQRERSHEEQIDNGGLYGVTCHFVVPNLESIAESREGDSARRPFRM